MIRGAHEWSTGVHATCAPLNMITSSTELFFSFSFFFARGSQSEDNFKKPKKHSVTFKTEDEL